jgi:N-acetylneuraminic acid mutarotase
MGAFTLSLVLLNFSPIVFAANCWKDLAPIASGVRQEHSVAAIGNNVYVVSGMTGAPISPLLNRTVTGAVDVYDTTTNKWSSIPPIPVPLHHPNVAAVDNKLYVLGGIPSLINWTASPVSFVFDASSNKWTSLEPLPNPRGSAAVGVHGKTVYLVGGLSAKGNAVNTVSSFDTASGKWTSLSNTPLPDVRDHGGAAVVDNVFYYVGGRTGAQDRRKPDTWALDLTVSDKKWVDKAKIPTPRGGIAVASIGGKIYTFGGEGNPGTASGVFSDVQVYDTKTDTWSKEADMKHPRHGMGAAVVGERIYIPGGGIVQGGNKSIDTVDSYGPC